MIIRKILLRLLGFPAYLKFVSGIFLRTFLHKIYLGAHTQVRFLEKLVQPGDYCLDIGANLGYFSVPLSHLVGERGRVFAVEPVPLFQVILSHNLGKYAQKNVEIVPYALGDEDGKEVEMTTPRLQGVVRHGRTQISAKNIPKNQTAFVHQVQMRHPLSLFGNLKQLNFVKCDVEGYELHIIPHLLPLFKKFRPILEIEIGPKTHKEHIMAEMEKLGYKTFYLDKGKMKSYELDIQGVSELYFMTSAHRI